MVDKLENEQRQALHPIIGQGEGQSETSCSKTLPGFYLRYGHPCPFCGSGKVDYNSNLNLVCDTCGKMQSGAYT